MIKIESDTDYHSNSEAVSRSGLWRLWTKTPAHFRYVRQPETSALALGRAAHTAILEPDTFAERVREGPGRPTRREVEGRPGRGRGCRSNAADRGRIQNGA